MKIFCIVLTALAAALLVAPPAGAYTFESRIDPAEFFKWNLVESAPLRPEVVLHTVANPDPDGEIPRAEIVVAYGQDGQTYLLGYSYEIEGERRSFFFNPENQRYERYGAEQSRDAGKREVA